MKIDWWDEGLQQYVFKTDLSTYTYQKCWVEKMQFEEISKPDILLSVHETGLRINLVKLPNYYRGKSERDLVKVIFDSLATRDNYVLTTLRRCRLELCQVPIEDLKISSPMLIFGD